MKYEKSNAISNYRSKEIDFHELKGWIVPCAEALESKLGYERRDFLNDLDNWFEYIDFDPNWFSETNTVVFGESGKKMNMQISSKSPDADVAAESKLIYDGTWLWVEVKVKKFPKMKIEKPLTSAMKIYIPDVSPDPKNELFNTIYGQTGTGIFRYKDLPGTFKGILRDYSFSHIENLSKSQNIIIFGTERPGQINSDMNDVDKELRDYIDQSTQFCKLWVSKDTGLVSAYFLGKSEGRPTMHTEIEYISVNDKLPKDIFKYISSPWGRAESAGINRHRVEGVSPLHERRSCSIMAPSHASAIREEAAKR